MVKIKTWSKIFLLFIIFLLFFILYQTEWYTILISGDLDSIVHKNQYSLLAITLIIMIIQNSFTIIPLIFIISINFALFGFINGFLWSWITSIIAAGLMFYGSRYLFQSWVIKRIDKEWLSKIESNGFIFVFQGRIIPFIPTSLVNIIGGISTISFKSFIFGTIIGNFIYFFILTLVPAGIVNSNSNGYIIMIIFLVSIFLYFIYRKNRKKRNTSLWKMMGK